MLYKLETETRNLAAVSEKIIALAEEFRDGGKNKNPERLFTANGTTTDYTIAYRRSSI